MTQNEKHSLNSTFRERVVEHLFVGEVLKYFWNRNRFDIEVLRPEFDRGGYDVLISVGVDSRFIQFKTSLIDGTADRVNVSLSLTHKPNACVIWILVDDCLNLVGYRWFGAALGEPFTDILKNRITKHTKGNKDGLKADRPNQRTLRKSEFENISTLEEVVKKLFE